MTIIMACLRCKRTLPEALGFYTYKDGVICQVCLPPAVVSDMELLIIDGVIESPELNMLIATKALGFNPHEMDPAKWAWWDPVALTNGRRKVIPGPYCTDIKAAWELMQRFRLTIQPSHDGEGWWSVSGDPDGRHSFHAPTAPLAICKAALYEVAEGAARQVHEERKATL